jgi:hypothetical protein
MKRCALLFVVFVASNALSQITDYQNGANFSCSGSGPTVTCSIQLGSNSKTGDLIAVWVYWQSAGVFSVSVSDLANHSRTGLINT